MDVLQDLKRVAENALTPYLDNLPLWVGTALKGNGGDPEEKVEALVESKPYKQASKIIYDFEKFVDGEQRRLAKQQFSEEIPYRLNIAALFPDVTPANVDAMKTAASIYKTAEVNASVRFHDLIGTLKTTTAALPITFSQYAQRGHEYSARSETIEASEQKRDLAFKFFPGLRRYEHT